MQFVTPLKNTESDNFGLTSTFQQGLFCERCNKLIKKKKKSYVGLNSKVHKYSKYWKAISGKLAKNIRGRDRVASTL